MTVVYAHPLAVACAVAVAAVAVAVVAIEADGLAARWNARRRPGRRGGWIL